MTNNRTPKHDAMTLWLMDPENLEKIIPSPKERTFHNIPIEEEYGIRHTFKEITGKLTRQEILTEVPLKSSNQYIGGYIDILVNQKYELQRTDWEGLPLIPVSHIIEIKPKINSFGEVVRQINKYKEFVHMRQTNYNGYSPRLNKRISADNDHYYLFTMDDRFDKQFESQKIHVLHPPEEVSIAQMMVDYGMVKK